LQTLKNTALKNSLIHARISMKRESHQVVLFKEGRKPKQDSIVTTFSIVGK
jgi:hypothetical protein